MTTMEWLDRELDALDKFELIALLVDFAESSGACGIEALANYLDNWPRHS